MSCQASKGTVTSPPPPSSPIVISGSIVIGYYPSWARYSFTYDKIDYSKFDIINHAFVFPSATTGIKIDADFLYPELVSSVHAHGKKILVTVGNVWGDPIFNTVMSDPAKRQLFISALKKVVIDNNYDGVDVDWEFPADAREGRLFLDLIRDLKIALPGKLVTVAISVLPHDFDLATLSSYADYINIMTYDMEAWYNYA
jgi:chitinase